MSASASPSSSAPVDSATPWWTPPSSRVRRRLYLEKVKRTEEPVIDSYSYGLDSNGALSVADSHWETTIGNDQATGLSSAFPLSLLDFGLPAARSFVSSCRPTVLSALEALASVVSASSTATSAPPTATLAPTASTSALASHTDSTVSASASSATAAAQTIQQKWDALGTGAHVGI